MPSCLTEPYLPLPRCLAAGLLVLLAVSGAASGQEPPALRAAQDGAVSAA